MRIDFLIFQNCNKLQIIQNDFKKKLPLVLTLINNKR